MVLVCLILQICLYYNDLYEFKTNINFKDLGLRLLEALGETAILLALIFFLFPEAIMEDGVLGLSAVILLGVVISWRYIYMLALDRGVFNQLIIIMGSGELAQDIVKEIQDE